MAVEAAPLTLRTATLGGRLRHRSYGLGSVFAKTIRDSRLAFLLVVGLLSLLMFAFGSLFVTLYPTDEARRQLLALVGSIPAAAGALFYGASPVRLNTLGGYISQDDGILLKLIPGAWSILALSGTLATEVRRGSLEFVAAAPFARRRIALEKLGAHVTTMALAMVVVAVATWLTGRVFARLPGDAISPQAAIGYSLWLGLTGLIAGSVAFAIAPLLGRAAAAGFAAALMFGGYVVSAYQLSIPSLSGVAKLTWFTWTAGHNPLAGEYDWVSLALVALVSVVLFALGVEAFARRDVGLGSRSTLRTPGLPDISLGIRGPVSRSLGELLPAALAWGVGIGLYGLVIAESSRSLAGALRQTPAIAPALRALFPGYDITTAGGVLEASFLAFGFVLAGLCAATLVAAWASDETAGRLEMLLSTPLARARWVIAGGLGVYLAIAVVTLITATGIGVGAGVAGSDPVTPVVGTLALGIYAIALASVGFAVAGLLGTALAAPVVAGLAAATFLLDLLAPPLNLPDWVHQLALTSHMGQPMAGKWDWVGIVASLVLALGGLLLGGWGMGRRDVRI